jgi:C1A family cysteine protease
MRIIVFTLLWLSTATAFPQWFIDYKKVHNKTYTILQEYKAFQLLKEKYESLEAYEGLSLRLHALSDQQMNYTNSHIIQKRKRLKRPYKVKRKKPPPPSHDWRKHHYVTTPKVQGTCGGCFAFAAIGHLEFWYKKKSGRLAPLSIQQALDCSGPESDGCEGGLMEDVYYHSYWNPIGPNYYDPWTGRDGHCKMRHHHPYVKVHRYISMSDEYHDPVEKDLAYNIYHYGPIPVAVDSTGHAFELYHNGIIRKNQCGTDVDHAVLVVGYTPEYWIVKNSWGTSWGQSGYIYIERGKNACGINSYAAFATQVSI